jgi:hypothetical protein
MKQTSERVPSGLNILRFKPTLAGFLSQPVYVDGVAAAIAQHLQQNRYPIYDPGSPARLLIEEFLRTIARIGGLRPLLFGIVSAVRASREHECWGFLVVEGLVDIAAATSRPCGHDRSLRINRKDRLRTDSR